MRHIVPAENWLDALFEMIRSAEPGDEIAVRAEAAQDLAVRAIGRMRKTGVSVVLTGETEGSA